MSEIIEVDNIELLVINNTSTELLVIDDNNQDVIIIDGVGAQGPTGSAGNITNSFMPRVTFSPATVFSYPDIVDTVTNANGDDVIDFSSVDNGSAFTLLINSENDADNHIDIDSGNIKINSNGDYLLSYSAFVERDDASDNGNRSTPFLRLQKSIDDGVSWTNVDATLAASYIRANNGPDMSINSGANKYGSFTISNHPIIITGLAALQSVLFRLVGFKCGTASQSVTTTTDRLTVTLTKIDEVSLSVSDASTLSLATKLEAEAGSNNTKWMSPLRTNEAIAALTPARTLEDYLSVATSTTLSSSTNQVEQTASGIITTLEPSPNIGRIVTIMNYGGGSNTIAGNGKNINGSSSVAIFNEEVFKLIYNGTQWRLTT